MDQNKTQTPSLDQEVASINAGLQNLAIRALVNDLAAARVKIAQLESQAATSPIGGDK